MVMLVHAKYPVMVMPRSKSYTLLEHKLSALLQGFVQCMYSACMSDSQIAQSSCMLMSLL